MALPHIYTYKSHVYLLTLSSIFRVSQDIRHLQEVEIMFSSSQKKSVMEINHFLRSVIYGSTMNDDEEKGPSPVSNRVNTTFKGYLDFINLWIQISFEHSIYSKNNVELPPSKNMQQLDIIHAGFCLLNLQQTSKNLIYAFSIQNYGFKGSLSLQPWISIIEQMFCNSLKFSEYI